MHEIHDLVSQHKKQIQQQHVYLKIQQLFVHFEHDDHNVTIKFQYLEVIKTNQMAKQNKQRK
jgi:hypothetical protein